MMASLTGNIVNLFFNWVLVLGNLGAPALGVRGSAIATLIGTSVEGLLPLFIFLGPAMNATLKTRSQWKPRRHLMKEILSLGWPAGAMFGSEMICWGFFMLYLVGSQGKEAGTAGFITQQWMSLSFMPTVGISFAISSTVGKYMGMKRPDLAALRAVVGFKLAIGYMTLCGVGFLLFRTQLINFFMPGDTPPDARAKVLELGGKFLIAAAAFQFFDGMAMSISGALRGAGDTKYLGVATVVLSWAIMVGGGMAIVRWVPQLGAVGPWVAAALYIVALALVSLHRYWGGAWRKLTVVDP
jgi:MATE family multidrug resistance protein